MSVTETERSILRRREHALSLLRAARILDQAGRASSAAVLREGLDRERLLLAVADGPGHGGTSPDPVSSELRVAAILDEFSTNSFGAAFQGTALLPDGWREQFEQARPQIFFCESAWSGKDSRARPWKGRIYASRNFSRENRGVLLEILAHCRKQGIPTVFWNKEDPAHYADRVHDFVKTATEFDHVFTTAAECVPLYRAEYGLQRVHALPFATNPAMFSPLETGPRSDAVTFAGSWYANHVERSEQMHRILSGLQAQGYRLEIHDRYHGDSDPLHEWPEQYRPFLRPAVPHDQVAAVYRSSRFGLNINTVTGSRTMFARRVFELMSSNTLVLSNHSVGMEELFGDDVVFCDRDPGRLASLSRDEIDGIRERNLQRVLSEHTYRHRWEEILTAIGFRFRPAAEAVTVIWPVRSLDDAPAALHWFQHEADPARDRLLLLATDEMPPLDVARLYEGFNRFGVTVTSLGHAERLAIEGRYAPVETECCALISPAALPPVAWLARARHHLQHARDVPISVAETGPGRHHHVADHSPGKAVLWFREKTSAWLSHRAGPRPVYLV